MLETSDSVLDEASVENALSSVATGAAPEEVKVTETVEEPPTQDTAITLEKLAPVKLPKEDLREKLPTLRNAKVAQSIYTQEKGNFSEHTNPDLIKIALDKASPIKSRLAGLKDMDPAQRAEVGAKFGGGIGLAVSGLPGTVLGAAIGAMGARGLGLAQSGEFELHNRRNKVLNTLKTLGAIDEKGTLSYEDGSKVMLQNDPSVRLRNISSVLSQNKKDRAFYEVDSSHPMTNRTYAVARPLARYLAQNVLNYNDTNNKHDVDSLDQTTGMLINSLQDNAKSIDQVYSRAKELAKKLKISEAQMRGFFDRVKTDISDKEAGNIKKGLDTLYA